MAPRERTPRDSEFPPFLCLVVRQTGADALDQVVFGKRLDDDLIGAEFPGQLQEIQITSPSAGRSARLRRAVRVT